MEDCWSEKDDLKFLGACALVVPLVWLVFLGWHPGLLIPMHDGAAWGHPLLMDALVSTGGDWRGFLYRADIQGGVRGADITGFLPIYRLCAALGIGPVWAACFPGCPAGRSFPRPWPGASG